MSPSKGHHEVEVADLLQTVGMPEYRPQFLTSPTGNNYTLFDRTCQQTLEAPKMAH